MTPAPAAGNPEDAGQASETMGWALALVITWNQVYVPFLLMETAVVQWSPATIPGGKTYSNPGCRILAQGCEPALC